MSIEFMFNGEETPDERIRSAVFQSLGAASVCWEFPERAGIFDSTQALEIGEALIKELGLL